MGWITNNAYIKNVDYLNSPGVLLTRQNRLNFECNSDLIGTNYLSIYARGGPTSASWNSLQTVHSCPVLNKFSCVNKFEQKLQNIWFHKNQLAILEVDRRTHRAIHSTLRRVTNDPQSGPLFNVITDLYFLLLLSSTWFAGFKGWFKRVDLNVTLCTYTQEDLRRDTDSSELVYGFPQSLHASGEVIPKICKQRFLRNPFILPLDANDSTINELTVKNIEGKTYFESPYRYFDNFNVKEEK